MVNRKLADECVWSVVRCSPATSQHSSQPVVTLNTLAAISEPGPAVWLMIWRTSGSGDFVQAVVVDVGQLAGALVGGRWHLGSDGGRELV